MLNCFLLIHHKVYNDDIILQMDAKMLGDEYNKCHPPKQVDFITAQLYEIDTEAHKVALIAQMLLHNSEYGQLYFKSGKH